jgi:mono/diheme cytochrome c family protein
MKAVLGFAMLAAGVLGAQAPAAIPRAWDSAALADWATPVAAIAMRPGHFSEDEYYRTPVDNYRTYPVYQPEREPAGYWQGLRNKKPEPLIDTAKAGPTFNWAAAGKRVWEEIDVAFFRLYDAESIGMARSAEYVRKNLARLIPLPDGTLAMYRWVVTPRGVALGITACSSCHTRYMDDGSAVAGPGLARRTSDALLDRMTERLLAISYAGDRPQMAAYRQFGVPWIPGDIHEGLKSMSDERMGELFDAQVAGVTDRPNGSPYYIAKVPDLIGIRDRKYIDHTATHRHRGPGDLMRYAALVEYSDSMDFGRHRMLSDAQRRMHIRWPDEVLYALAQYIYSLQPPPNPNRRDELAAAGEKVFARAGCGACHTPPLYTNNKLAMAPGFRVPENHPLRADILPVSIGTDPGLALKTRKGTGLYKVPTLKGVWYRGLYGHDGAVASLEDWLDAARLRPDYMPTGFKGVGVRTRAVPGHEFGLSLNASDKKALIAFLRTL